MIRTAAFAPFLLATTLLTAAPALASDPASLALTFDTGANTGAVMVALYDETGYAGGQPVRAARIDVAAGEHSVTFEGLPAGDYGVKAFHDLNGNGQMDTNPFGMPVEPYAFSNNAVGNMGPASWDRAKFSVSGVASQTISIR
ncbi:DUF2141 domain-containing protein [Brevundimonas sp. TWP2-3-4b1]|uniref:DUF2141 domain-containing protein n=1 Tax=Brevundimonas sp. TWP2-3-4b1 TaxID=2804580 RepID=UPI003CF03B3B